ncbi:MAG: hypothetical protein EXS05_10295 [Planctomycetaceae bacterium]|nr:hypothetical protein [Planctomycetaceae bacterium]
MMPRSSAAVFLVALVLLLAAPHGHAAKRGNKSPADSSSTDVLRALRAEVVGAVDRRAQLSPAMSSSSDSAAAFWQAGFVRESGGWRSFDAPEAAQEARYRLDKYSERRSAAAQTFEGQLQLANWCRTQGFADQQQSHLQAALLLDPEREHPDVLERIGRRNVGGLWLSREQLLEWQGRNLAAAAALKKWGSRLDRIGRQLSGNAEQNKTGRAALKDLADPSMIPALEYALCGRNQPSALGAVEAMARFETVEASQALAKQAAFSSWAPVREAAAQALVARPMDEFVPQVVSLLETPITTSLQARQLDYNENVPSALNGALLYSYVMARETDDQFQVRTLNTINVMVDDYVGEYVSEQPLTSYARGRANPSLTMRDPGIRSALARGEVDANRVARDKIYNNERRVAQLNERTQVANERIGTLLAAVSGRPKSADPKTWWNWWSETNEIDKSAPKSVSRVTVIETVGDRTVTTPGTNTRLSFGRSSCECLAAGTTIWTESGTLPIEHLQVGDRVLAKNIETGELAYRPVLQTTVRTPRELVTMRIGDETFVSTGAHRFWVSGAGWTKARDILPQSLVHTATGNLPVWSVKKGETAATYNLVVADFHTYFIGTAGILSQDVLLPRATNKVVPGLDRSQIAAGK